MKLTANPIRNGYWNIEKYDEPVEHNDVAHSSQHSRNRFRSIAKLFQPRATIQTEQSLEIIFVFWNKLGGGI